MSTSTTTQAQGPIPVDQETLPWPFDIARSTGTTYRPLLAAILATDTLPTVPVAPDGGFQAIGEYLRSGEYLMDAEDRSLERITFWVCPAGTAGLFHEAEGGEVKEHGLLVTVERGAKVDDVVEAVKGAFVEEGTAHVHVPAV
ncbi:uncharacterized protein C8Q71DRAFT_244822 [Rhodofomes roseus]|uniref:Uncharacterized protein n=1 Tax=Rhodofomes roseus TaxID=34475 RepID=A0ABQ8K6Q2_9APHY|nr:uncharacterized protein C8Q71DRAFT_244822 [Rhodofomes roseus]KAH9832932.1 hypothetical protein C8Q71DRAFT_244822 [Rhodofomes roseus]